MGSVVSPMATNLYMQYFEQKALRTATRPPKYGSGIWMTLGLSKGKIVNKTSLQYNVIRNINLTQIFSRDYNEIDLSIDVMLNSFFH